MPSLRRSSSEDSDDAESFNCAPGLQQRRAEHKMRIKEMKLEESFKVKEHERIMKTRETEIAQLRLEIEKMRLQKQEGSQREIEHKIELFQKQQEFELKLAEQQRVHELAMKNKEVEIMKQTLEREKLENERLQRLADDKKRARKLDEKTAEMKLKLFTANSERNYPCHEIGTPHMSHTYNEFESENSSTRSVFRSPVAVAGALGTAATVGISSVVALTVITWVCVLVIEYATMLENIRENSTFRHSI